MTTERHPVTGVELNPMTIVRTGKIDEKEQQTAALLLADGIPRWLVAAKLGRFPLAFTGTGRLPERPRSTKGGHLKASDARNDPRQVAMDQFWQDLFGDGHGNGEADHHDPTSPESGTPTDT